MIYILAFSLVYLFHHNRTLDTYFQNNSLKSSISTVYVWLTRYRAKVSRLNLDNLSILKCILVSDL